MDSDRAYFLDQYRRNRRRSAAIFGSIDSEAFTDRPIELRHPFIFYEGHLPAFSFLTLCERALGEAPVDPELERLFERGIDPSSAEAAAKHQRQTWPERDAVAAFGARCDERIERAFAGARIDDPDVPRLVRAQSAWTVLEHEQMHHETLTYIMNRLDPGRMHGPAFEHRDWAPPRNELVAIGAGTATLGANPGEIPFGWDNEFGRIETVVPAFSVAKYPVTNADWLEFVRAGGPKAPHWILDGGEWKLRCVFEVVPLPRSWPVYVSHRDATAYAQWKGVRLPSEAEYHRYAYGAPDGFERAHPWGSAAPETKHGNFDFARVDPEPVDAHPAGDSAWGVSDTVGNGWEWTSTPFAPFPGFEPMASYPQYSADFFDGEHYVIKGASPVTAREMIRRSFRNWFYHDYPYAFATFRCVA